MAATTPVKSISLPPTLPNPACTHADIVNSFDEKSIFMNCIAVRKPVPFFHTFSPEFMVVCLKPFLDKMLFIIFSACSNLQLDCVTIVVRACQMCGAEIRYGRFCPECSAKLSRDNSSMVYVGEKPKHKMDYNGKMHTLDESEMKNVSRKPVAMRRKDKK